VLLGTSLGLVRLEREAALVLSLTGSAAKVGIVTFVFGIPFVLFALLAGALLDRVDRKRVMIAARYEPGPFGTVAATFPSGRSYQPSGEAEVRSIDEPVGPLPSAYAIETRTLEEAVLPARRLRRSDEANQTAAGSFFWFVLSGAVPQRWPLPRSARHFRSTPSSR